jgi:pimeloyl-ACP methyl ester carboxylesterase
MNNDVDCIHEKAALDVKAVADEMFRRGAEAVIMLGNSGGASLTALAHAEFGVGDGWIGMAAHPGEGSFMGQSIDPSISDESDPFSVMPELDMYNPDNGWRPWPEQSHYDETWLNTYRAAQLARVARLDAVAQESIAFAEAARTASRAVDKSADPARWRHWRARAVWTKYMVIYRTLANPAYLDLSIDPDDRPMGTIFAFPDPMEANYARNGIARTMTARGWLSTWSALSSKARMADTMPTIHVPTLLMHPTADTEIRRREAQAIYDNSGAADKTFVEITGAPHYLEGYRTEAMNVVIEWLRKRFP